MTGKRDAKWRKQGLWMTDQFEVAIIGAGPAGLGAATNAAKHKLKHILFERSEVGNTIFNYQAKKYVMAEPQRLPLRSHVPFEASTREKILELWNSSVREHQVNFCKADVTKIEKMADLFHITASGKIYAAKYVILSIGVQGTPNKLKVPGEELPHVAYTLSDPESFIDKNIIVVGAGDAAIENALALSEKNKVSLLNLSEDFPRAKEANATKIMNAIKAGQIKMYSNSSIARIEKDRCFVSGPQGELEVPCDHIIVRIGGTLPRKFLESCGVQFPSLEPTSVPVVDEQYQSNVKGLFILGALIGYPLIKQGLNQGHEVIETILGNQLPPADQVLIEESLSHLPGSARENLTRIRQALPLFKDLSEAQWRELIIESKVHDLPQSSIVFEKNDYTDTFFSLISGEAQIELAPDRLIKIEAGNFFGEMGLISGRRRVATVRISKDAVLLESPRKQILKLMKSVPTMKKTLDEFFMLRALESTVFPGTDPFFLRDLVAKAKMKSFKKNEILFKEGDIGDLLYVVRKGSVKISKKNARGVDITVSYVPAGHVVGEMALLSADDVPRSATASAAVACETILIEKLDFQELLKRNSGVRSQIEEITNLRRVQNIRSELNHSTGALLDFIMLEGVTDADNILIIDSDLCVGCDNCEKACAATHGGNSRLDRKGGKSLASIQIPISCRHCENPLCMTDCPPDALTRKPNGEVVILDSCIGCGNCVHNCPYGVIQLVKDREEDDVPMLLQLFGIKSKKKKEAGPAKAAKCDLCQTIPSGPACVRSCPTGAALRVNPRDMVKALKEEIS